jgi:predicted ester cyclase
MEMRSGAILSDYDAYWDSFDEEVQQSADKRNDAYLKHNSQQSGILSYGESVDLLLAYAAKYGSAFDYA